MIPPYVLQSLHVTQTHRIYPSIVFIFLIYLYLYIPHCLDYKLQRKGLYGNFGVWNTISISPELQLDMDRQGINQYHQVVELPLDHKREQETQDQHQTDYHACRGTVGFHNRHIRRDTRLTIWEPCSSSYPSILHYNSWIDLSNFPKRISLLLYYVLHSSERDS